MNSNSRYRSLRRNPEKLTTPKGLEAASPEKFWLSKFPPELVRSGDLSREVLGLALLVELLQYPAGSRHPAGSPTGTHLAKAPWPTPSCFVSLKRDEMQRFELTRILSELAPSFHKHFCGIRMVVGCPRQSHDVVRSWS